MAAIKFNNANFVDVMVENGAKITPGLWITIFKLGFVDIAEILLRSFAIPEDEIKELKLLKNYDLLTSQLENEKVEQ